MPVQLRQICLVASELQPAIEDLTNVLGINTCFVDEGVAHFGLENTLMTIGNNFLEVVAPTVDGTAAGRYLDRRQGDGGYMVICQAGSRGEQEEVKARAADHRVRIAYEAERENWNICQFHPADMVAAFLEVDWDENNDFDGNWMPAGGTQWVDTVNRDSAINYRGVELQADDVEALAARWSDVTGIALQDSSNGPILNLNNAVLRFVPATDGRGAGLGGIDLAVRDKDAVLRRARARGCQTEDDCVILCGTRFHLFEE